MLERLKELLANLKEYWNAKAGKATTQSAGDMPVIRVFRNHQDSIKDGMKSVIKQNSPQRGLFV